MNTPDFQMKSPRRSASCGSSLPVKCQSGDSSSAQIAPPWRAHAEFFDARTSALFFSRRGPGVPCRRWCRPVEEARSQKGFHRRCCGGVRGHEQLADLVVGMQEEILHVASVTQVDGITTVSHRWQTPRASEGERVMYDELQQPFGVWKRAST